MSSNSIYPNKDYFYIIEHIITGLRYAGSKYTKSNAPGVLWKDYYTSSEIVKDIIDNEGFTAFKIVLVKSDFSDFNYLGKLPIAYAYEQSFLRTHNCRRSKDWLNHKSLDTIVMFVPMSMAHYIKVFDSTDIFFTLSRSGVSEYVTQDNLKKFCNDMKLPYLDIVNNFVNGTDSEYELLLSPNTQISIIKTINKDRRIYLPAAEQETKSKPRVEGKELVRVEYNGKFSHYKYV